MTLHADETIRAEADRIAGVLADPIPCPASQPWLAQSLAQGTAGIALLHVERAHAGQGTWRRAHSWVEAAAAGEASAAPTAGLYLGLPALAFVLDTAGGDGRYETALKEASLHLTRLALSRADAATTRLRSGQPGRFHEWDVFYGLAGIGALLLRRDPGGSAMERVLRHLVALTCPLVIDGTEVPGWWVDHDPQRTQSPEYPGGHLNFGAAHGIAGPLALLGHALRRGVTVDGQQDAVASILAFLDAWRQESSPGPWWPEWITMADLVAGRPSQRHPNRPSWCYGTSGIARAGQIAAIGLGDTTEQRKYEQAMIACLRDPAQVAKVTEVGLCHGAAGLYMTAMRAAGDAATPDIAACLPGLAGLLLSLAGRDDRPGFLDGAAGTALVLYAADKGAPLSGWDSCLLIS